MRRATLQPTSGNPDGLQLTENKKAKKETKTFERKSIKNLVNIVK